MENRTHTFSAKINKTNASRVKITEEKYVMNTSVKTIKTRQQKNKDIKENKKTNNRSIQNDLLYIHSQKQNIKNSQNSSVNTMIQPLILWKGTVNSIQESDDGSTRRVRTHKPSQALVSPKLRLARINRTNLVNIKEQKADKINFNHQKEFAYKKVTYINTKVYKEYANKLKVRKKQQIRNIQIRSKNINRDDIYAIQNIITRHENLKKQKQAQTAPSSKIKQNKNSISYSRQTKENHIRNSESVLKSKRVRNVNDLKCENQKNQNHDCIRNTRVHEKTRNQNASESKELPCVKRKKFMHYPIEIKHELSRVLHAIVTNVKISSSKLFVLTVIFCGVVACIYPILISGILGLNSFYFDSGGNSSKEDESIAIKMATKMNKLNTDYWSGVEGAISNRKELEGMDGYHVDLDIPEYAKVSIKFYDAYGKEIDLDDTTNNKAILSLASCYQMEVDSPKQSLDYQDYCTFLWIASHEFKLEESEPYKCNDDGYEIETSDQLNPPSLPEGCFFRNEVEGGLDELPGKIWCEHGHWAISEVIPHEHEDSDGNTYYTYTYMWKWLCDQHINAIMYCNISNLNVDLDDPDFDLAKLDERIFEADFIGSYLTNEIIEEYCDENGRFDVDAWISEYKPKNFDTTKKWLEDAGNEVPDLKEYICSKVRGTYDIKNEGNTEEIKNNAYNNIFSITAYADPMYGAYMWKGWTDDMKELVEIRNDNSYESVKKYDNLLSNKRIGSGATTDDYTTMTTLINNYYSSGQINKRQKHIMTLALASVGRIPYYYGGGHSGGGAGQYNDSTGYTAEGDPESYRDGAPDPSMAIPAETFYKVVGTDWYKRIQRGLDCSSFVWFLYASDGCPIRKESTSTYDIRELYPTTHNPRPCDLFVIKGHVMIYMGNMDEATEGINNDKTPYYIELTGSSKYAVDTVRIRYGLSDIPSRKQNKAKFIEGNEDSNVAYIYKDMSKYYDKPLIN